MAKAACKAERPPAYYEPEVSYTGEAGLQQCLIRCQKNPGHQNFIPADTFNIEHLPPRYRDKRMVDWVKATSDMTCRLSLKGISDDRPDYWPFTDKPFPFSAYKGRNVTISGTGWVSRVVKHTDEDEMPFADENRGSPSTQTPKKSGQGSPKHTPKKTSSGLGTNAQEKSGSGEDKNTQEKTGSGQDTHQSKVTWGTIVIVTACHVICNDEEARNTKCQFFYDSHETDVNNVLTLTGVRLSHCNFEKDWCRMIYVTRDLELLDQFEKILSRWHKLRAEVFKIYPAYIDIEPDLCFVVSHPHGRSKQISVGNWTDRDVYFRRSTGGERVVYTYNTPTCPGSSGAAVITLYMGTTYDGSLLLLPPHSQGRMGNDNSSGSGVEDE